MGPLAAHPVRSARLVYDDYNEPHRGRYYTAYVPPCVYIYRQRTFFLVIIFWGKR